MLNELALFAGAGGGILGGHLLGWRTVCAVEWELYPASVLISRQNDGILPPFPVWDDVQTFDGKPWRGRVDVISGGFPCQDISAAGKGAGIDGKRSGTWGHMARIVDEVRPRFVFVENSPFLMGRGLARVLGDLASMGYDAEWCVLGARHVAAPHKRDRIWLVATDTDSESGRSQQESGAQREGEANAHQNGEKELVADSNRERELQSQGGEFEKRGRSGDRGEALANAHSKRFVSGSVRVRDEAELSQAHNDSGSGESGDASNPMRVGRGQVECEDRRGEEESGPASEVRECSIDQGAESWWAVEPNVGRVADGVAARVDRLKALGNGQVSAVAELAWKTLKER